MEIAVESFTDLNQQGKKLQVEDIFLAHIYNANKKFSTIFHKWRRKNIADKSICASINEGLVTNTFSMIYQMEKARVKKEELSIQRGLKYLLQIATEIKEHTKTCPWCGEELHEVGKCDKCGWNPLKLWEKTLEYIKKATKFLKEDCDIRNFEEIPTELAILILATFFYYVKSHKWKDIMRKWFWRICLSSRYSGKGYSKAFKDPIEMIKLAKQHRDILSDFPELKSKELVDLIGKTNISGGKPAFLKCIKFVLLEEQKIHKSEKMFPTRTEKKTHSKKKKAEDHFFPKWLSQPKQAILGEDVDNVANMVLLTENMNVRKSKILPFIFLHLELEKRKLTEHKIKIFLKANLIPEEYKNFNKQFKKEENFCDPTLKHLKKGVSKRAIQNYYGSFISQRTKLIRDKLYELQF